MKLSVPVYYYKAVTTLLIIFIFLQCNRKENDLAKEKADRVNLLVPQGFEVTVVADSVGPARHIAVNDNGDLYVKLKNYKKGGLAALRDTTDDGKADIIKYFKGDQDDLGRHPTGISIYNEHLYFSSVLGVYRYKLTPGKLLPEGEMDTIIVDDHEHSLHSHMSKAIAFDDEGNIYTNFGVPGNACQDPKETPGLPGLDPCPHLKDHGGIWKFNAKKKNQTQSDGSRLVTGTRNIVAIDWNREDREMYAVMHGRDYLHRLFPSKFSKWENAVLPAEEFLRLTEGANFGWPYCYYDHIKEKKVLAPEYGGDGEIIGRCSEFKDPIFGFPGHFAPNDMVFYYSEQFPEHYQNGAFIIFHGSTIRSPYPQAGYFLAFAPFNNGKPAGEWEVFANGFAGVDPVVNVSDAKHRPSGLAVGPDGSLYITEDRKGTIWRIRFTGDKGHFGAEQLARMKEEKQTASNIRRPKKQEDILKKTVATGGEKIYDMYCSPCHQQDGKGTGGRYPPLVGTEWILGDKERLITIILNGMEGPIDVNGETYNGIMPQHSFLSDEEVAEVVTYIRQNFGNDADSVETEEVSKVRETLQGKTQ